MFYIDAAVTFTDETKKLLDAHMDFLNKYFDEGIFVMFGLNTSVEGHGFILAKAESKEVLEDIFKKDPLWEPGLITYDIQELAVRRAAQNIEE